MKRKIAFLSAVAMCFSAFPFSGSFATAADGNIISEDGMVTENDSLQINFGVKPEVSGDINSDGSFNAADVLILQKWFLGDSETSLSNKNEADFNGDGVINIADFCIMKEKLAGQKQTDERPVLFITKPEYYDNEDMSKSIMVESVITADGSCYTSPQYECVYMSEEDHINHIIEEGKKVQCITDAELLSLISEIPSNVSGYKECTRLESGGYITDIAPTTLSLLYRDEDNEMKHLWLYSYGPDNTCLDNAEIKSIVEKLIIYRCIDGYAFWNDYKTRISPNDILDFSEEGSYLNWSDFDNFISSYDDPYPEDSTYPVHKEYFIDGLDEFRFIVSGTTAKIMSARLETADKSGAIDIFGCTNKELAEFFNKYHKVEESEVFLPDNDTIYSAPFYITADHKLYARPDINSPVTAIVPKYYSLREIGFNENNNEWLYTEYNGRHGWVRMNTEDGKNVYFESYADKPVIYLYPEEETDIHVELELKNATLSTTYPKYRDGWNITAYPDGTLLNRADGTHHNYLFWDACDVRTRYDFSKGFCVAGNDTEAFLKEKLSYMGLNENEMNEFIVYWLPLMEYNKFNYITFQTDAYTDSAKLNITPEPDSICRIFMVYVPLDEEINTEPQQLDTFERKGFTVVEWGGSEIKQ